MSEQQHESQVVELPRWFVVMSCAMSLGLWIGALFFITADELLVGVFLGAIATLLTYTTVAVVFQRHPARERIRRGLPFVAGAVSVALLTIGVIAAAGHDDDAFAAICLVAGLAIGAALLYLTIQLRRLRERFPTGT